MPQAIDMHIHPPQEAGSGPSPFADEMRSYFRSPPPPKDADEMAQYYQERDIVGLLLASDWESTTGEPPRSNDYVAGIVRKHPKQFIGFCCVDPSQGRRSPVRDTVPASTSPPARCSPRNRSSWIYAT